MARDELQHTETSGRLADLVICAECDCSSGLEWRGWLAYRVDDPHGVRPTELGFYCPTCAADPRRRAVR